MHLFKIKWLRKTQLLFLVLIMAISLNSCGIFNRSAHSDKRAQKEMIRKQNKAIDEEVKIYDKKYKEQTNRQDTEQRKMIKKSRKKPKHMRQHEHTFFLWRWLGI